MAVANMMNAYVFTSLPSGAQQNDTHTYIIVVYLFIYDIYIRCMFVFSICLVFLNEIGFDALSLYVIVWYGPNGAISI